MYNSFTDARPGGGLGGCDMRRAYRRAFSLVEVLLGMLILLIALLAMASTFIMSTKMMVHTIDREKAIFLAAQKLDELEGQSFDKLGEVVSGDVTPGVSWIIADNGDAKTVVVSVAWEGLGAKNEVSLSREYSRFSRVGVDE